MISATVAHGSTTMWYLTRSTGLVSLVLLTGTVVLGMISSVGWTTERWPRFVSQAVHRNLSLLCVALIGIHVATTVADGYVPIGFLDAIVPFRTAYRPLYVGLGALSLDLLLAVALTSGLRRRIGADSWRAIHWLAYLCWPIALIHALGTGSDTRLSVAIVIEGLCVVAVVTTGLWRLSLGRARSAGWRAGAAGAGVVVLVGIAIFAFLGPLQPGWSRRAGTSATLLNRLGSGTTSTSTSASGGTSTGSSLSGLPAAPFTTSATGTYQSTTTQQGAGVTVVFTITTGNLPSTPLVVTLDGTPVAGGVSMSSGQVTWGAATGTVTGLRGSTIEASVRTGANAIDLVMGLSLDQATGSISGSITGTAASRA